MPARAAEDLVGNEGGKEIRIVAGDARVTEDGDGLRDVEGDHGDAAVDGQLGLGGKRWAFGGQVAEECVEDVAEVRGRNIAGRADVDMGAGERAGVGLDQVVPCQGCDGFDGAFIVGGVGVVTEDGGIEGLPRDRTGVGRVGTETGEDLAANALDGVLIKTGREQRLADKRDHLAPVFGQKADRDVEAIVIDAERDAGGEIVTGRCKGACVHLPCALVEEAGHQVGRAAFAGQIEGRAAEKAKFERGEGDRGLFDEPRLDTAGRGDLLNVDGGTGGRGEGQGKASGQKNTDHCVISSSPAAGMARPVTALLRSKTRVAAAIMSSAVTACSTSGQA